MREGIFLGGAGGGRRGHSAVWDPACQWLEPLPMGPIPWHPSPTTPGIGALQPSMGSAMGLSLSFPQSGRTVGTKARTALSRNVVTLPGQRRGREWGFRAADAGVPASFPGCDLP